MNEAGSWSPGGGLHGYAWDAADPRGVVLIQHGYGEHAGRYVEQYAGLVPKLVERGLSVRAFDMRGHGRSPGARVVTDIDRAVADHLSARMALAALRLPLFLFGHSLGGLVTAAGVAREPTGVAGVVLSSAALLLGSSRVQLVGDVLSRVAPGVRLLPPQSPTGLFRDAKRLEAFGRDPLVYRGKMPILLAATALSVSRDAWRRYAAWTLPTLVFHGTADTFTDVKGSELFASMISSADRTLLVVPDGRHELLNDVGGEALRDEVIRWLEVRSAGSIGA